MGNEICETTVVLPDTVLLYAFSFLDYQSLVRCAGVCVQWYNVASDKTLWKRLFIADHQLASDATLRAETSTAATPESFDASNIDEVEPITWLSEYKRLHWRTPCVETQKISSHIDEVLHVAFAPNGRYFSTCSKDAFVKVWSSNCSTADADTGDDDCSLLTELDMRAKLRWRYTQFSQFNKSSQLLLVSGVHNPNHSTAGEIAVYFVDEANEHLSFRCRVYNRPYDVFGCWFDESHLLSGEHFLFNGGQFAFGTSTSHLWLCKASQDTHTERTAVIAPLFKFFNRNGANLRMVLCSDHVSDHVRESFLLVELLTTQKQKLLDPEKEHNLNDQVSLEALRKMPKEEWRSVLYKDGDQATATDSAIVSDRPTTSSSTNACSAETGTSVDCSCICHGSVRDRLLIFSTGTDTYTPHQIGFKLVNGESVLSRLNAVLPPERREAVMKKFHEIRDRELQKQQEAEAEPPAAAAQPVPPHADNQVEQPMELDQDDDEEQHFVDAPHDPNEILEILAMFDQPDYNLDMHGHIIGMTLSHCKRYLFVNVRPWPTDALVNDPWAPPTISDQIEIRVIDLNTLTVLSDKIYRGHHGYTQNDQCFFIFLDGNDRLIASGSEDHRAVVWSRDYNCVLATLEHANVVNSVAISPANSELMVTASDDHSVRVFRSRRLAKQLKSNNKTDVPTSAGLEPDPNMEPEADSDIDPDVARSSDGLDEVTDTSVALSVEDG